MNAGRTCQIASHPTHSCRTTLATGRPGSARKTRSR
jgi:hypothetical protein